MKQGRSLSELAQELERQHTAKRDFLTDTRNLELVPCWKLREDDETPALPERLRLLSSGDTLEFSLTQHTHRQISSFLGIPAKYYDRMRQDAPALLAHNVNYWFNQQPSERMIRTLDGRARAFLSNRYRRLDNFDLLHAVMPVLSELKDDSGKGLSILSCEVTETRLYLKCLFPRVEAEVKKGDPVQSGLVISNSEIGLGALTVTPLVYRLICTNGMVVPDYGQRKYHVGRVLGSEEASYELFSDETLEADDRAFWLKTRDIVRAAATPETFRRIVSVMHHATYDRIREPVRAVEELSNHLGFNRNETEAILEHFMQAGDYSRWGLANAVTRTANDLDDYDRASELEAAGWTTLTLGTNEGQRVAKAA